MGVAAITPSTEIRIAFGDAEDHGRPDGVPAGGTRGRAIGPRILQEGLSEFECRDDILDREAVLFEREMPPEVERGREASPSR